MVAYQCKEKITVFFQFYLEYYYDPIEIFWMYLLLNLNYQLDKIEEYEWEIAISLHNVLQIFKAPTIYLTVI